MRWVGSVVTAVLCITSAGSPQDAEGRAPLCSCFHAGSLEGLERLASSGDPWTDAKLKGERRLLEVLFQVEPEFLLLADDAPRDVFFARDARGRPVIGFKASWLVRSCSEKESHRRARLAYAVAHQYAHVLQWKRGCKLPEMAREKQADLIAGWYLGKRNIGTLEGGPPIDAEFTKELFARSDPFLNDRFEHGRPGERALAVATGFELARRAKKRLSLRRTYERGIDLFPPPEVGVAGGAADARAPALVAKALRRLKVECEHRGPCTHKVECEHRKPCTHKVPCRHLGPCVHRIPCTHKVPCAHRQPCVHRVRCRHKVPCTHTVPCRHRLHRCDYLHECDYDARGNAIPCIHEVPCVHFRHRFDYLHNFDYAHDWDFEHEFDTLHEFDLAHEFDTEHEGDPVHEFDFAHDWDPQHAYDLAHEFDPVHDYDVKVVPKEE